MNELLTNEQVAYFANLNTAPNVAQPLAREVQAWRALINGGTCPACGGKARVVDGILSSPCPNPDCVGGRVPGVIERLEPLLRWDMLQVSGDQLWKETADGPWARAIITAVIAELQEATK